MTTMELIPNFAATPVPPFVSDPRYVSSGRALADLWPESPHAARNLNEAHNRMVYEDDTSVMPYIEALTENHTVHLNEITKGLDSEVAKQDGMVSQRFDKGDVSFFAESKRGVRRSPLDLTALGLPPFQSHRRDEKLQPLAVIVHSAKKTGDVGAIELIVASGERVESRFLENIPAAENPNTHVKSRWVNAGESLISRPSVRAVAKKTEGKSGNTMIKLVTEDPAYGKVEGGEARIIRHKPTHAENIVSKPYHERPRGKAFTRLGLAAAGLAVAATVSSLFGADASKNREIKSAHELVLPAGTKMQNGIEQAEGHFKEPELSRSRKAFEAYLAGDMEALRNQAKAQGYESNWMKGEAITAVEQAKTYEELVAAFDKAFDGLPVKLKIYEAGKNEPEGTVGRYEHEPASNFNSARQLALATVRLFNVMDKEYLQKGMKPLNYIIVGDITDTQKEKDPPGYHVSERDLSYIVLSDQGSAHERLVGHETGHYQDLSNGYWGLPGSVVGSISSKVSELHTGQYVGPLPENYEGAKTKVEGWNSVADPYGNADAGEDTATLLETINRAKPVMRWENSPLGEKQMVIIFEMERKYPGFTASFLERTTTDHQWETGADIRDAMLKMEGLIKPSVAGAMLTLLALAGRRARSVYSRMTATAFGLYPKRGQIAANPAEVISIS